MSPGRTSACMMWLRYGIVAAASVVSLAAGRPSSPENNDANTATAPLPLVIWHGLGDKFDNEGLQSVGELAQAIHPDTYVYFVRLGEDGNEDRSATFFGNVSEQIERVCQDLRQDPKLRRRGDDGDEMRVDAMGFSQGGQFLRGLIQRCDGLSVRSLVTFGSQHNGIAQFQTCGAWDLLCKGATAIIKGNAWTEYAQTKIVPAQYYRTVNETTGDASDEYLQSSRYLADINNEREQKQEQYAERLAALEKFVMYVFEEDTTVIPKESGWFAEVNATSGEVTHLRDRAIYQEDWLGLKRLDAKKALEFRSTPGRHMALDEKVLKDAFRSYFGPETGRHVVHDQGGWRFWRNLWSAASQWANMHTYL